MTIEDDISFFERVPTLNLLGRQALRILAIGAQTLYVHSGETLYRAGDEADGGFVVQEGRFRIASGVSRKDQADSASVVVGPFTLLGEVALVTRSQRPATAIALEPASVLLIPRPLFLKMLDSFPDNARRLRDTIAGRLNQSTREIHDVRAVLDAYEPK
jgi:CRP-like cAMP-binding protein